MPIENGWSTNTEPWAVHGIDKTGATRFRHYNIELKQIRISETVIPLAIQKIREFNQVDDEATFICQALLPAQMLTRFDQPPDRESPVHPSPKPINITSTVYLQCCFMVREMNVNSSAYRYLNGDMSASPSCDNFAIILTPPDNPVDTINQDGVLYLPPPKQAPWYPITTDVHLEYFERSSLFAQNTLADTTFAPIYNYDLFAVCNPRFKFDNLRCGMGEIKPL